MKRFKITLLAIFITATTEVRAAAPACNIASFREARLRCATISKRSCLKDVYMALEGGGVDEMADFITCASAAMNGTGKAMQSEREAEQMPPANQRSTFQQAPQSGRAMNQPTNSPGSFQGVAPFGQSRSNAPTMQPPGVQYQYPGALPPQITEMMRQMQQTYAPRHTPTCQGVTTSALTGFDQSGNKSSASRLEKFEVVQITKSQQNGNRTYLLSTNGFWYDAGYIKKDSACNL